MPYVTRALEDEDGPIVAVSDWVKAVPEMIARWVPGPYAVLGTDGFGRSGTRKALRRHFRIDPENIALAVLYELSLSGSLVALCNCAPSIGGQGAKRLHMANLPELQVLEAKGPPARGTLRRPR